MYELGNKIAANGQPFLTQDQIEELIKQRRGGR
jgi:hypothetical protein